MNERERGRMAEHAAAMQRLVEFLIDCGLDGAEPMRSSSSGNFADQVYMISQRLFNAVETGSL